MRAGQGDFAMAIAVAADFMRVDLALANATLDRQANRSEAKIAEVVHRLLLDHSIDRTFDLQDDLREVGLTSLDMASLVLSVEAEFDLVPDAWYFAESASGEMPFSILIEAGLQPCGWLSCFTGIPLRSKAEL